MIVSNLGKPLLIVAVNVQINKPSIANLVGLVEELSFWQVGFELNDRFASPSGRRISARVPYSLPTFLFKDSHVPPQAT